MKKIVTLVLAFVMLLLLISCGSSEQGGQSAEPDQMKKTETLDMEDADREGIVDKLIEFGLTENEAKDACDILHQCGFASIGEFEKISGESETVDGLVMYMYKPDKDHAYRFIIDNREIFYIALNGEDLYDRDKGGFLQTIDEVHVPETFMTEEVKCQLVGLAEEELDAYFGEPRYYDAWGVAREDDKYMVQCEASDGSLATSGWLRMRVWYHADKDGEFELDEVQQYGGIY